MISASPPSGASAVDTTEYIGGIARELRGMALKADVGFLAYLLAMVTDEAEAISRRLTEERADDA